MSKSTSIISKALDRKQLTFGELMWLYENENLSKLCLIAHSVRLQLHPNKNVGWMIDRNINITNVCTSGCKFCTFHCSKASTKAYITSLAEYEKKIEELFLAGGNQILLQGGMHPDLTIEYYEQLFRDLKNRFPSLKLHALGPPEIFYLAEKSGISLNEVLKRLIDAGLDSLPGAGAEILDNDIRKNLSPHKCSADDWAKGMIEAHKLNLPTSATMVFGHIETMEHRISHLIKIREIQNKKPEGSFGFLSFILWSMQTKNTILSKKIPNINTTTQTEYLKMVALSRIALINISNIQSSLLTIGINTAQLSLYAGANDLGSIMLEENVLSAVGLGFRVDAKQMKKIISDAGFNPTLRNQKFEILNP